MTYLDYSATTPINDLVLKSFCDSSKMYPGNPNSLHTLGVKANELINDATEQIASLLNAHTVNSISSIFNNLSCFFNSSNNFLA